ncbi:TPA: transcriptional regulator [Legionella pneumophila]|nr:transcriptional regulator [Legionella pneumophila]HAT1998356.1 transcriptional regulator [Legionella pneumophila]
MDKKSSPENLGNLKRKPTYDNSLLAQHKRILKHFKNSPTLSTFEARDKYGIPHPSGRVLELRKKGYLIDTHWVYQTDNNGVVHRIGLYLYRGRKETQK